MDGTAAGDGSLLRVDLHAHTHYSADAGMTPQELVHRSRELGLDRVAVTDHGEVEGAFVARALDPELIIVGEEVRCAGGVELIGLFLEERIPSGLTAEETADRIRGQGGVVYAPHPYAYVRRPARRAYVAVSLADAVEAYNSRAFWPTWNRRAGRAALAAGRAAAAGSDAHFVEELGRAYTEVPAYRGAEEFRRQLSAARPVGRELSSPFFHARSAVLKAGRLAWAGVRGGGVYREGARLSPSRGGPAIG